jgi:hypothetical protein
MKEIITAFANGLVVLVLLFLPFAFVTGQWNPIQWHIIIRALYVLSLLAILTYGINEYNKK